MSWRLQPSVHPRTMAKESRRTEAGRCYLAPTLISLHPSTAQVAAGTCACWWLTAAFVQLLTEYELRFCKSLVQSGCCASNMYPRQFWDNKIRIQVKNKSHQLLLFPSHRFFCFSIIALSPLCSCFWLVWPQILWFLHFVVSEVRNSETFGFVMFHSTI